MNRNLTQADLERTRAWVAYHRAMALLEEMRLAEERQECALHGTFEGGPYPVGCPQCLEEDDALRGSLDE